MRLSDGEKLILWMLAEIHEHLQIKNGVDPALVSNAIRTGHLWALRWQYRDIFEAAEYPVSVADEVADFLGMWISLEEGWNNLSTEERAGVEEVYLGAGAVLRFPGFDGDTEGEYYGVADMLINKLGRFEILSGRDLNSHFPSVDTYRRMHKAFEAIRATLAGRTMNAAEIETVLKARIHPEYRGGGATN